MAIQSTVDNLYRAGLSTTDLRYSIRVADEAFGVHKWDRFRYFCGVAWKRVAAQQEMAKSIYEADRKADG